jgi:hypothetical protein
VKAYGRRTVTLEAISNGKTQTVSLHDTLYAPAAANNLLSIPHIDDAGGTATFQHGKAKIFGKSGRLVLALGLSEAAKFTYPDSEFNNSSSMCVKMVSRTYGIHVPFTYICRGYLLYVKLSIFFNV